MGLHADCITKPEANAYINRFTVYLSVLEQENDVFSVDAGRDNGLLDVFFEFLEPVVVRHVHANKSRTGHTCGELSQRLSAASCASPHEVACGDEG